MERTASRHEGDRATQEFGLPACALGGHSDPGYRPGGDTRGGAAVETGPERGSNAFTCSLPLLDLFHLSA